MKIDGYDFENLLWENGIDASLDDSDSDMTVLLFPLHRCFIGNAWADDESEAGWSFDIGDVQVYVEGRFHIQSDAESAEDLLNEILGIIRE